MVLSGWKAALTVFVAVIGMVTAAEAQDWTEMAKKQGVHLLMRHAVAPGTGDPDDFEIGDCSTQRNLSDDGKRQARRTGKTLRDAGVPIDVVLTSQWCRTRDTAELLDVAPVEDAFFLNSFFRNRSSRGRQTQAAIDELKSLTASGQKAMLVTHQVNVTALTDIFPSSGELILISLNANDEVVVEGRIPPADL